MLSPALAPPAPTPAPKPAPPDLGGLGEEQACVQTLEAGGEALLMLTDAHFERGSRWAKAAQSHGQAVANQKLRLQTATHKQNYHSEKSVQTMPTVSPRLKRQLWREKAVRKYTIWIVRIRSQ